MTISEEMELMCFQLITQAGSAKSSFMEAVQKAKQGNFEEAALCMKQGDAYYNEGHAYHAELIQKEAEGKGEDMSLILVHAEDQMMSCEVFRVMAQEIMELYQKLGEGLGT